MRVVTVLEGEANLPAYLTQLRTVRQLRGGIPQLQTTVLIDRLPRDDVLLLKCAAGDVRSVKDYSAYQAWRSSGIGRTAAGLFLVVEFLSKEKIQDGPVLYTDPAVLFQRSLKVFLNPKPTLSIGEVLDESDFGLVHGPAKLFGEVVPKLEADVEQAAKKGETNDHLLQRFVRRHSDRVVKMDAGVFCPTTRYDGVQFDERLACYQTSDGSIPTAIRLSDDGIATVRPPKEAPPKPVVEGERPRIEELTVGLQPGAAAFPLKRHAVFLRSGMAQITERWLRRLSSDAFVVLLADLDMVPLAEQFATRFRQVRKTVPVEPSATDKRTASALAEALQPFRAFDAAMVPTPRGHKDIEFIPGSTMPDIAADYGVFRFLWRAGFRQFALWSFGGTQQVEIPHLLDRFAGIHRGKRCFVVGNGPSLNQIDMSLLKDEITLGSNRCYLGFDKWGYEFDYWACVDRLQLEEYALEYSDNLPHSTVKFFPFEYVSLWKTPNACPLNFDYEWRPPYRFSASSDVVHLGFTVTQALLQIAACMGCNPIYLIGVDHRYNLSKSGTPRTLGNLNAKVWVADDASKPTHFTDAYTAGQKPMLFVTPKPERAEACFEVAHKWAVKHDVQILNATANTALNAFPKVDFESIFAC